MDLELEIFLCACNDAGAINYAHLQVDITERRCDPDDVLHEELNSIGICPDSNCVLVHSTSWRYEEGRTVLTYLVWSPLEALQILATSTFAENDYGLALAAGKGRPRPPEIGREAVLSHGLRHFRFLAEQQELPIHDPDLCKMITAVIGRFVPVGAGRI